VLGKSKQRTGDISATPKKAALLFEAH